MATARENNISSNNGLGVLRMRGYDIEGNKIRAFFDASDNLIFVIDDTVTPDKPNALLVINSDDSRKWDDILSNDYDVSLEMVRPKKDNKYQKLDIDYAGLDEYDDLIRDYDDGTDLAVSLNALARFRAAALRRIATERLQTAENAAENARETIERAQTSIAEQQARIKTLRTKLSQQKKSVGREPTKQSAAKILRTESQIDAIKDKQTRAQRRLDNARRRLVAAEEDADIARAILARYAAGDDDAALVPMTAPNHNVATVRNSPVAVVKDTPIAKMEATAEITEPKAEEMAEEVKPLFDKDPEILDEEIAFKPIDFGAAPVSPSPAPVATPVDAPAAPRFDDYSETAPVAPLSFVPPAMDAAPSRDYADDTHSAPVLDTIKPVEIPADFVAQPTPVMPEPMVAPVQNDYVDMPQPAQPAPIMPEQPAVRPMAYAQSPVSGDAPAAPDAPVAAPAPMRPASPVTGRPAAVPVGDDSNGRRPTLLYYLLLIALIALSIFTLWLYQKKNNESVPDLAATTPVQEVTTPQQDEAPNPFIAVEETVTDVTVTEPEAPAPTPAPIPEPEPEPVVDDNVPAIPVPVVLDPEPAPIKIESPFFTEPEPEPEPVKKPVIVNKPAYNAGSLNDNMFVAAADYDTDVVVTPASVESAPGEEMPDTPIPAEDYQETVDVQNDIMCDDGTLPTADGCCGDEMYTDMGDGSYACCSDTSGQCFPPMF